MAGDDNSTEVTNWAKTSSLEDKPALDENIENKIIPSDQFYIVLAETIEFFTPKLNAAEGFVKTGNNERALKILKLQKVLNNALLYVVRHPTALFPLEKKFADQPEIIRLDLVNVQEEFRPKAA